MVNFAIAVTGLAAASMAVAAPTVVEPAMVKRAAPGQADIDTVILNYALTLEHLESAFYRDHTPSKKSFQSAGFPSWVHDRFIEIGGHEAAHVSFLSKALGDKAVKECKYEFGVTDVKSFIATSQLLEGVGVSAYLGAAQNITNTDYLTAAGSILTAEARHSAWIQSAASKSDPFGGAQDTPTTFNQTYSLAAPLIKSCPKSNAKLPVAAFPAATISPAAPKQGETVQVKSKKLGENQALAFITAGGVTAFAPIKNGKATLPSEVGFGRTYAVIVPASAKTVTDDNTVAGPVAFDILPSASKAAAFYEKKYGQ